MRLGVQTATYAERFSTDALLLSTFYGTETDFRWHLLPPPPSPRPPDGSEPLENDRGETPKLQTNLSSYDRHHF